MGEPEAAKSPDFKRVVKRDTAFAKEDRIKMRTDGLDGFSINREDVDLRYVEQLVDAEQLTALSHMIKHMKLHVFDGRKTMGEAVEALYTRINNGGFQAVFGKNSAQGFETEGSGQLPGNLAMPRKQELYAALNRCRSLISIELKG